MPHHHTLHRTRVWDLPTRGFHALIIVCVIGLVASGEIGGNALQLHFWLGYATLTLVLFRLVWGLVGGHWSRFVHFVPSPTTLRNYLHAARAKASPPSVGHNPLGALSVLAMLCLLLLQVFSGFMSDDEISNVGPWTALVPSLWVELATEYHGDLGKALLIGLIALHVGMVLYYKYVKREDLITPMITGDKVMTVETPASRDTFTSRLFALGVLVGCAYVVYCLVHFS